MKENLILLVEDNADDEELALLALKRSHITHEVVVARDGEEALDYLFGRGAFAERDTSCRPQVILLDLKLPKMGGLEVLQRLRADERTTLIPVVILTSSSEEKDILASYRLRANSYVRKPVEFQRFVHVFQQLGSYWLELNDGVPKSP